jgi:hypothetical protein
LLLLVWHIGYIPSVPEKGQDDLVTAFAE